MSAKVEINAIYVAICNHDARFSRICAASIRAVYPDVPIRLLIGGHISHSRLRELAGVWDAHPAPHVPPGEYGWGFVKLEPLFGPPGERFLVLDSDTALLGPVLEGLPDAPFIVDREEQTEEETRRLYYDWEAIQRIDTEATPPAFVFNTGQWVGTAGALRRDDFAPFLHPGTPSSVRDREAFRQGEQGLFNYVLNRAVREGRTDVARHPLMRWPGHDTSDVHIADVAEGPQSPHAQVMHWAGFKAPRLAALPRADLLRYFEQRHYAAQGGGEVLRRFRAVSTAIEIHGRRLQTRLRQRFASVRP